MYILEMSGTTDPLVVETVGHFTDFWGQKFLPEKVLKRLDWNRSNYALIQYVSSTHKRNCSNMNFQCANQQSSTISTCKEYWYYLVSLIRCFTSHDVFSAGLV